MRLELRGHHVDVTPGLRRFVEEKLSKLERLLKDRAVSAQAVLTIEKRRHVADITLHARGVMFLHGVGDSANWETSLNRAMAKISRQAEKLKTRQKEKRHKLKAPASSESAEPVAKSAPAGKRPGATRRPRANKASVLRASLEAIATQRPPGARRNKGLTI